MCVMKKEGHLCQSQGRVTCFKVRVIKYFALGGGQGERGDLFLKGARKEGRRALCSNG